MNCEVISWENVKTYETTYALEQRLIEAFHIAIIIEISWRQSECVALDGCRHK